MKIIDDTALHGVLKPEEYLNIGGYVSRPALDHAYYVKHKYDIYNLMNINKEYDQILHKDGKWFSTGKYTKSIEDHKNRFGDDITFSVDGFDKRFFTFHVNFMA